MPKIIAISSVSGGGKTTVINDLKKELSKSVSLHFDDYNFDRNIDYGKWLANGGDYNEWDLTPLKIDICEIIEKKNADYIILDYPFAYRNELIKPYIDLAVYIDTPLDIAMVRRILRDMGDASGNEIRDEIENYLNYARNVYQYMLNTIPCNSDFVVNGNNTVESITALIKSRILNE